MSYVDAAHGRLSDFWFRRGPYVVLLLVGAINVVVLMDVIPEWTAPRTAKLVLLTVDASVLLGYAPAKKVVDFLWTPSRVRILAVDSEANSLVGYELTPDEFAEVEIDDGHLHQWTAMHPTYEALEFDAEELQATATWKGTATDLQLVEYENKVNDVRGDLSNLAEWGVTLRMRFLPFVRAATAAELEKFVELFEDSTLPKGDAISDAIEDAKPDGMKDERGRSKEIDETKIEKPPEEEGGERRDDRRDGRADQLPTEPEAIADD